MKKQVSIIYCLGLLICSGSLADLSGSDDFNDNVMDPAKWSVLFGEGLSETNNRLELSGSGAWVWELNNGSCADDWTTSLDIYNSINETMLSNQEVTLGFVAYHGSPNDDLFSLSLSVGDNNDGLNPYRLISTAAEHNNVQVLDYEAATTAASLHLQISFDATTKVFTSYYDAGSGLTALTNYHIGNWGMTESDVFTLALYGDSIDLTPEPGEVFGDNFVAIPEPGTLSLLAVAAGGFLWVRRKKR